MMHLLFKKVEIKYCIVCRYAYGMVWYGMVWYGMVWYGIVLYCIVYFLIQMFFVADLKNIRIRT